LSSYATGRILAMRSHSVPTKLLVLSSWTPPRPNPYMCLSVIKLRSIWLSQQTNQPLIVRLGYSIY